MSQVRVVGRYAIYGVIASGGMATVHYGRLVGEAGFSRTVAVKRLHPQFAADPEFVAMMVDEARIVSRIRHPNVVPTLDVVVSGGEVLVVMDYVAGDSLSHLQRMAHGRRRMPPPIAAAIVSEVLCGLQAAHEATDEKGAPLGIVHRDVSPQNVLLGVDGHARVIDFGVAKAAGRTQTTRAGTIKGKIAYMAPEQMRGDKVTGQTDVFAASIVLWELLAGQRLFQARTAGEVAFRVVSAPIEAPSRSAGEAAAEVQPYDAVVLRGLARDPAERFASAAEMREALEACGPVATAAAVSAWVRSIGGDVLARRDEALREIEASEVAGARPQEEPPAPSMRASSSSVPPTLAERSVLARRPSSRGLIAALVIALVAGTAALAMLVGRGASPPVAPMQAAAAVMVPVAAVRLDVASASASGSALASVPAPASAPASASTSAPAHPRHFAPAIAPPPAGTPIPRVAAAPPVAAVEAASAPPAPTAAAHACVPFTWDDQGVKHYNPACL